LMAAGQWPDLLSEDMSTDLGSVVLHSIADLDLALSDQLILLKSEGLLSPMRSSLSDLDQSVRNTRLALFGSTDESGQTVIPVDWKPPGWEALKNLSLGRFACLGVTAALCSAVSPMDDTGDEPPPATPRNLADVLTKAKQSCASILDVCKKLSGLDLSDSDILASLDELSDQFQYGSKSLFECVKTALSKKSVNSEDLTNISSLLEKVLTSVRLLAALVRKAELDQHDTKHHHYLSAEFGDSWLGVTEIVSQVRNVNGDPEDVNYLMRARAIENQLAEAVENEPKLAIADAKIAGLEKVSKLNIPAVALVSIPFFSRLLQHLVISNFRHFHLEPKKLTCSAAALQNWRLCWLECRLQLPCLP
jgi:dynactin 1